jgi:hypothetical protein
LFDSCCGRIQCGKRGSPAGGWHGAQAARQGNADLAAVGLASPTALGNKPPGGLGLPPEFGTIAAQSIDGAQLEIQASVAAATACGQIYALRGSDQLLVTGWSIKEPDGASVPVDLAGPSLGRVRREVNSERPHGRTIRRSQSEFAEHGRVTAQPHEAKNDDRRSTASRSTRPPKRNMAARDWEYYCAK